MVVRKLRLQRGWTQEQLAELTGLSVRSIQRIERGQPASLESQKALAAVFDVELSLFQPGDDVMNTETHLAADESRAIDYARGVKEFWSHALMYVIFAVTFIAIRGIGDPVILWGAIGWGIGVVFHGLVAFEVINIFSVNWEKRLVEKKLGRKL